MESTRNDVKTRLVCAATTCAAVILCGCTMQQQSAPALAGPSGFGVSLSMTASPTVLPRDSSTQTTITVVARDASGQPQPNVSFKASVSPSIPLVQLDAVTGSDGAARFLLTAPALATVAPENNQVVLRITPLGDAVGGDFQNARAQSVAVGLLGPQNATYPSPDFTISPEAPKPGGSVVLDATKTTDEGIPCVSCTYLWDVAGVQLTGPVVAVFLGAAGDHSAILTVVDATGTSSSTGKVIQVVAEEEEEEEEERAVERHHIGGQ